MKQTNDNKEIKKESNDKIKKTLFAVKWSYDLGSIDVDISFACHHHNSNSQFIIY